jgi:hypothetical protein
MRLRVALRLNPCVRRQVAVVAAELRRGSAAASLVLINGPYYAEWYVDRLLWLMRMMETGGHVVAGATCHRGGSTA